MEFDYAIVGAAVSVVAVLFVSHYGKRGAYKVSLEMNLATLINGLWGTIYFYLVPFMLQGFTAKLIWASLYLPYV